MSIGAHGKALRQQSGSAGEPSIEGRRLVSRIAVGVDGYPGGRDAVALGSALAGATGAELMLVAVHLDPMVPVPSEVGWSALRKEAERTLREVRDAMAPQARIVAESDLSVPRALHRAVRQHHRDLLVVGSSRDAGEGRVRIGKRTRQLLCHFDCALAIAPRGLHTRPPLRLRTIGVGYDGGSDSRAALAAAGSIAAAAGAELRLRSVIDDRVPVLVRSALSGLVATEWRDAVAGVQQQLHEQAVAAAAAVEAPAGVEVIRGRPADGLLSLSGEVDLLVIGSRRWGPAARLLLGSTGEAVLHDATCPVLVVPRSSAGQC
jgi:nucleotide-binding universal stress UspA family protein